MMKFRPFNVVLAVALAVSAAACKNKDDLPSDGAAASAAPAPAPAASGSVATPVTAPLPEGPKNLADPIFRFLPRKLSTLWVFPHPESTGPLFKSHFARIGGLLGQGAEAASALTGGLAFGVLDPLDAADRQRFGVDGKRAFAMVVDPADRAPFAVLPISSFATFEQAVRAKLGAGVTYEAATAHGKPLTVAKRGARVIAAYADAGAFAFLAPGDEDSNAKAALDAALAVTPAESLGSSPDFQRAARKLSTFEDLLVYFDGGGLRELQIGRGGAAIPEQEKRSLRRLFAMFPGVALSVSLTPKDVVVEAYLSVAESAQFGTLFPKAEGFSLARFVDSGAIAALKGTMNGVALLERVLSLDPSLKSRIAQFSADLEPRLGVHLERDLLRNVTGRLAFALVALDPDVLKAAVDASRPGQVLRHTHFVLAAELKDKAGVEKTLATAAVFLRKRPGAKLVVRERDVGAVRVRDFSLGGGPTVFSAGIVDDVLLLTTGVDRFTRTLAGAAPGAPGSMATAAASDVGKAFAADQNLVLSLRFDVLLAALRAFDLTGAGARGAEAKGFVEQRLYPALSALSDLTVQVRHDGQGLKVQASIRGK